MTDRVLIGKIVSAHGIKGLVKIFPMVEDINLLNGTLFVDNSGDKTVILTLKNPLGKYYLAEIEGITDRNAAETLKCSLFVSRETLPDLEAEDGFYIEDLIGLKVLDCNGELVGTVTAVDNFGASDLLEIDGCYYIPLSDDFVTHISIDSGTVTVENYEQFRNL